VSEEKKNPVYLLDAMSFIFRAFHAMERSRPMTNSAGQPTGAVYVFVNMIRKLRADFGPEYLAAVFDLSGEVFRDQKAREIGMLRKWNGKTQSFDEVSYEGYKANRAETPEALKTQIPLIRRALEALQIPILAAEGFEADDVIGTLARQAAEAGHEVYIVSGDKDMMQLVTDQVRMLNPQKDNLILDPAKVEEVFGLPPEKVVDVMALRGDAIDNVPGAPGIGDKGSIELIREFGTLEALLDRHAEVKRKGYRESLEQNRETVLLSKELVTIDQHVPVELDLAALQTREADAEACHALFTELEFTSMLKELSQSASVAAIASPRIPITAIEEPTAEDREKFFAAARATGFAFVVEAAVAMEAEVPQTMSLLDVVEAAEKHLVAGVSAEAGIGLKLEVDAALKAMLEDAAIPKLCHDAKAAMHVLAKEGIALRGLKDDAQLLSYALNPTHNTQALGDVAVRTGYALPATLAASAATLGAMIVDLRSAAVAADVAKVYEELDLASVPVLFAMEEAGIRIDAKVLEGMSMRFAIELDEIAGKIYALAGRQFNINSPKQLGEILYGELQLPAPPARGKTKSLSTAQDVLEKLAEEHEMPRMVLEYRQMAKLKSTYVDALPLLADAGSRIHTTFQIAATATGRLSSVNPNLQNIPVRSELGREIRKAFVASPGTLLLSADYSQIELRLMAHFSEDPKLVAAYQKNEDIHTLTASEVFGVSAEAMDKETRGRAKAVNFGIVYGISAFGLAAQLNIGRYEAQQYIDRYFERYAGVAAFIARTIDETRKTGSVRTLFGRLRPIPEIESRNQNLRGFAERTAVNTPLQGTAADLMKLAMIRVDAKMKAANLQSRILLQVHDELLFEVPVAEKDAMATLVQQEMENVAELKVPLVVDLAFGDNWKEL